MHVVAPRQSRKREKESQSDDNDTILLLRPHFIILFVNFDLDRAMLGDDGLSSNNVLNFITANLNPHTTNANGSNCNESLILFRSFLFFRWWFRWAPPTQNIDVIRGKFSQIELMLHWEHSRASSMPAINNKMKRVGSASSTFRTLANFASWWFFFVKARLVWSD